MPDIFLSYNREDSAVAQLFRDVFAREGFEVWWDATLRSGEVYDQVTEDALRTAKAVVVLWSPRSVLSRWVRAEATIANRNGTLVPVTIEACERPVMFELTQTADLSHWRGDDQDKVWLAFLSDVRGIIKDKGSQPAALERAHPPPISAGGVPLVAVMPITCRSSDALELLAEDLTEDITRELAQNSFFRVIAAGRNDANGHGAPGADYRIEGKLQAAGENIRLTLQLIDATTGAMLKAARFARTNAEIEAEPEEFAVAVATEFGEHIILVETNAAISKHDGCTGWEHALRALVLIARLGPQSQRRGLAEARNAVAAAPDMGLAHAVLAMCLGIDKTIGIGEIADAQRLEIHDHIKRAMQLDGDNPVILYCVSTAYASLGDDDAALRIARRAVALAPNSPLAHCALAHAFFAQGRSTEAIAAYNEQLRLAPHALYSAVAFTILGIGLYIEGKLVEAEAAIDNSLSLHPDYAVTLMWKAVLAAQQGREQEAQTTVRRLCDVEPEMTIDQYLRLMVYYPVYAGQLAKAVTIFRHLWNETQGGG